MTEYIPEWRQCSVCKADARTEELVHYSTRRYAHGACLYKRDGFKTLGTMRAWQLRKLPVLPMREAGCSFDELTKLIDRVEAGEKR